MQTTTYKYLELLLLFIVIPLSFLLDYSPIFKLAIGLVGFVYVVYVLLKVEKQHIKVAQNIDWKSFFKTTFSRFLIIVLVTTVFIWMTNKSLLFHVLLNKPKLWLFILFVYSLFSVYPQELIFRTFFFKRYRALFKSTLGFIIVNAVLFALAHVLFKNTLVLILTFLGGILFALSYYKTKSTLLVSIEHAIYGCWLFTVGMGSMLGFPS